MRTDARLLIGGQALRAAGYGFTAVVLGALLAARGYSHLRAGVLFTALIAGTAVASLAVRVVADRIGRRRCYAVFFLEVALAGAAAGALGALAATLPGLGRHGAGAGVHAGCSRS
jgi:MFS family permease